MNHPATISATGLPPPDETFDARHRIGGMKQSGLGREIGPYGLDEFLKVRTRALRIGRTRVPWVKSC